MNYKRRGYIHIRGQRPTAMDLPENLRQLHLDVHDTCPLSLIGAGRERRTYVFIVDEHGNTKESRHMSLQHVEGPPHQTALLDVGFVQVFPLHLCIHSTFKC